jgi:heavy metal sensor kinase
MSSWRSVPRRLTFRLTFSYLVFYTILLALVGVAFRNILITVQQSQVRDSLEADWAALRLYLQPDENGASWNWDPGDNEQEFDVERLRRVFMLADKDGKVIEISPTYRVIGEESQAEIQTVLRNGKPGWATRHDPWGTAYLIRSGVFSSGDKERYYVAIGRSLLVNQALVSRFTLRYFTLLPVIVCFGGLLGWYLSKRSLRPLRDVARTSESITATNLNLRIPLRGADDELDQLIDTFNRMIERLESNFQQMRQFTTDVSHELRTPITAVRGELEVALMRARSKEELLESIQLALDETERLSNLVRAMLALSHAELGQTVLHKRRLDLSTVAAGILDMYRIPAEEASVNLITDLTAHSEAEVDQTQFERLVSNLLSNAIKHTPGGGNVTLSVKPAGRSVQVIVEDTGCGIPPEHLPHIFDRFYRVPGQQHSVERGLGLGLSFSSWIVKAHGGTINATSKPGEGTKFTVTLPAAPERLRRNTVQPGPQRREPSNSPG